VYATAEVIHMPEENPSIYVTWGDEQ